MKWKVDENFLDTFEIRESRKRRIRKSVELFLKFLNSAQIESITEKEIDVFLFDYSKNRITEFHVDDLKYFFDQVNRERLSGVVDKLKYKYTAPFKIKGFKSVDSAIVDQLETLGVFTNYQLFYYLQEYGLKKLLTVNGIELDTMIRVIRLSDITRIFAVKETFAELYLDSGFDSVKVIAGMDPSDMIDRMSAYVKKMQISNLVPKPKEATFVIRYAKKIVENSDIDLDKLIVE